MKTLDCVPAHIWDYLSVRQSPGNKGSIAEDPFSVYTENCSVLRLKLLSCLKDGYLLTHRVYLSVYPSFACVVLLFDGSMDFSTLLLLSCFLIHSRHVYRFFTPY